MSKVAISLILALVIGGGAVGAIYLSDSNGKGKAVAGQVSQLREEIGSTQDALAKVTKDVAKIQAAVERLKESALARAASATAAAAEEGAEPSEEGVAVASLTREVLRDDVFALIAEERKLREEERQREREERDKLREQRQKEMEELSKGPYERLNLKVNSMAKVLGLDDFQKNKYFEINKKYQQKLQDARTALFPPRPEDGKADTAQADGGRRGRGGDFFSPENRDKIRQTFETVQQEYATEVEAILTEPQLATYNELSDRSRSLMSDGMVVPPGEEDFGMGGGRGGFGGFFGGGPGGGPGSAQGGGQQGGGRGGRGGGR